MPGLLLETMDPLLAPQVPKAEYGFSVLHQKVELEVDFATQSLVGRTEITIVPQRKDLREIKIDARQFQIPRNGVLVNGKVSYIDYEDPNEALHIPDQYSWGVSQYELQRGRLKASTGGTLGNGSLLIEVPDSVHIEEVDPFSDGTSIVVAPRGLGAMSARPSVPADGAIGAVSTPGAANSRTAVDQSSQFAPLIIKISFSTKTFRDGLQFVGLGEGDARYPHVYTRHSLDPGVACCVFPCIDDPNVRCTWDISLKFSRTLGDALKKPKPPVVTSRIHEIKKAHSNSNVTAVEQSEIPLSEEDKLLEMTVVCSGELTNEVVDIVDSSKKTVSFSLTRNVAAQHIGFAIGPFEQIDLSEFREEEDAEKLGQGQAVQVSAFALPGRAEEVRNICSPLASAVDYFSFTFGKYDFPECKMCFVDDQVSDTVHTASLSLCSTRLLISEAIIDPEIDIVRTLVHAVANQWMGVAMIPQTKADRWIVVGIAHFMTGLFMKTLCGTNEYMFRQKALMERLVELDVERPSLYALGTILHLGSFEYEFMALKAPLVLFILDKRMKKATGSQTGGLARIVNKMVTAANTGSGESMVSTDGFAKLCYKISKYKCESFWNQWVTGAGCPKFQITQKYNKKQFQLELTISQKQGRLPERKLERNGFLREFKEEASGVWAGDIQPVFTGPMTIRIHEADGTPYEHIVEIREGIGRFSIPYNTKYKRLKRSRRQKERANAAAGVDITAENQDDVLIYCLGDVLQSREEVVEWGLADWDPENEAEMEKESYEWLRIDADFEWLCEINFVSMKSYMYVSQLQQDRDVVAQQDSINFLQKAVPHPLVSTFLIRTLMDRRYFHGIRTMATEALKTHATTANMCNWVGLRHLEKAFQEFFCYPGTKMPRSNDFSDKKSYYILCAIPRAMAHIRDNNGNCPKEARQFILDQLRFNDNGNNEFSDNHYIANLLSALADSLIPARKNKDEVRFGDDEDDFDPEPRQFKASVLEEIDRYRRMDEWIFSYQNIYTTTAIDCWYRLMEAGIIPTDPLQFMQYLHDGTADLVRIKAFEALVNLGFLRNDMISAYLLNVMSTDSSSFVRRRLYQVFCVGLATIAFGENKAPEKPVVAAGADEDNMIVDTDATLEARKSHIARTTTITGALAALKEDLGGNEALKKAIWKAIRSPVISLSEQADLLDICWILYDPQESWIVQMKYPRYWKAENLGKGIIRFKQTDKVRKELTKYTKNKLRKEKAAQAVLDAQNAPVPIPKPAVLGEPAPVYVPIPAVPKPTPVSAPIPAPLPTPVPTPVYNPSAPQPTVPTLKFSFKKSSKPEKPASVPVKPPPPQVKAERPEDPSSMRPPKRPLSHESRSDSIKSEAAEGQPTAKRRKITKLKFTNFSKVQKIQSQPPRPAPVKVPKRPRSPSASFTHTSPVSSNRPSPAPTSSTNAGSPAPGPSGSQNSSKLSITVKPRKPLPDSAARKPLPDSAGRKPLPDSAARKPLPDSSGRNPLPSSASSKAGKPQRPTRRIVKLKFTNYERVRRILSLPPKPLRVKAPKPSPPAPSVPVNRP